LTSGAWQLRRRWPYLALAAAVVAFDQVTKALVDRQLTLHESVPLVEGLLSLSYVRNRGGAFGFLSTAGLPYQPVLFAMVSVLALSAMLVYALRLPPTRRLPQTALALVMGGAIGNLIDRASLGYVIDFVDVYWGRHHWPAFNAADSAISVGVTLLILDMLLHPEPRVDSASEEGPCPSSPSAPRAG
jgi:signal peptidase II